MHYQKQSWGPGAVSLLMMFLKNHAPPGAPLAMQNTVDLRTRNANTRKLASLLPYQRTILYCVAAHQYVSSADGVDVYEQICVEPEDVLNLLLNTPEGTIKSLVMSQGNCNAVATCECYDGHVLAVPWKVDGHLP
jgi:hypothetical protein